ncbi:MAG: ABC transporter ATP-binding protein [Nanoarchaeota archaeon]
MMSSLIKLENVHKIYRLEGVEVPAINGISLSIDQGDFVALIGPSGSGKSTAMNLVGCLDTASKGDIFLGKHNIQHLSESDLAQIRGKQIGFIFQTFNLIPSLDALENVALPMMFQGVSKSARISKAQKLLEQVGLADRMHHLPNQLSGGQRQRVAIARALVNDPEIILADEPTGNLDTKTGDEIMKVLKDLNKQGKTIILVTHNPDLTKLANKVIKLKDGKIVESSKKLYKNDFDRSKLSVGGKK